VAVFIEAIFNVENRAVAHLELHPDYRSFQKVSTSQGEILGFIHPYFYYAFLK
jgi:hypothetical protein